MIVNKHTNPDRDLYSLGASVINIIASNKANDFGLFETYQELSKNNKVSLQLFLFVLDWLFILGAIRRSHTGSLEKCF